MAAPMDQVGTLVPDGAKARENRHLVFERPQRLQLRHDFVARPGLARNPARSAGRSVSQAQPPEVSAEPDRQLLSIGVDRAIAVEELVEDGKAYANSRTLQQAAQE